MNKTKIANNGQGPSDLDSLTGLIAVGKRIAVANNFDCGRIHKEREELQSNKSPLIRSQSIPISNNGMRKTPSELELRESQELADYRDYVMFSRIVDRLAEQKCKPRSRKFQQANDACLAHVISTRSGVENKFSDYFMGIQASSSYRQPSEGKFFRSQPPESLDPRLMISSHPHDDFEFLLTAEDFHSCDEHDSIFEMEL